MVRALVLCCATLLVCSCSRYGFDPGASSTPREAGVGAPTDLTLDSTMPDIGPDRDSSVDGPAPDLPPALQCGAPRTLAGAVNGLDALLVGSQLHVVATIPGSAQLLRVISSSGTAFNVMRLQAPSAPAGKIAAAALNGQVHLLYDNANGVEHVQLQPQGVLMLQSQSTNVVTDLDLASDGVARVLGVVISDLPAGQYERRFLGWGATGSFTCNEPPLAAEQKASVLFVGGRLLLTTVGTELRLEARSVMSPCTISGVAASTPTFLPQGAGLVALRASRHSVLG